MAGANEIVIGDAFVIPPPRRRRQRRLDPNAPVDSIGATPGLGDEHGRSEQDVPPAHGENDDVRPLAQSAIPANPFASVVENAPQLPPAAQVLGDAQRGGIQLEADDAQEAAQQARVDLPPPTQLRMPQQAPIARVDPSMQLHAPQAQGATVTGAAAPRLSPPGGIDLGDEQPLDAPGPTQLRMPSAQPQPMAHLDPSLELRAPQAQAAQVTGASSPQLSTPRGGIVLDDEPEGEALADEEELMLGAPTPTQKTNDMSRASGAYPGPSAWRPDAQTAQDDADRLQAVRTMRAQRALAILSAVPAIFGGRSGGVSGAGLARLSMELDPQAPLDRIKERRTAREQAAAAADQQSYERAMEDRRAGLEDRRIAQAESATEARNRRTAAQYDVDSQDADALRRAYLATVDGLSDEGARIMRSWLPREYGGTVDLGSMNAAGVQALLEQYNRERDAQAEENPRAFRLGRHGGGRGRAARGALAGLNAPTGGRGHDYGGPIGDRYREGGDVDPVGDDELPPPRRGVPSAPRSSGGGRAAPRAPQAPRTAGGSAAQPARGGRLDISQREPTPEEYQALSPDERSTVALLRAYRRAHPGSTWDDAAAAAPLLQPAERSSLLAQHGSDSAVQVPGWRQTVNMQLQPQELRELRAQNAATDRMASGAAQMEELVGSMSAANLARNAWAGDEQFQAALNISREMQATMRALQNMGVPNGPEMAMALEQAGEPRTPRDLAKLQRVYRMLRRWALEQNRDRMQSYGFVRRRGGR